MFLGVREENDQPYNSSIPIRLKVPSKSMRVSGMVAPTPEVLKQVFMPSVGEFPVEYYS